MNKANRKELSDILAIIQDQCSALCGIAEEEEEKFDNMPEGLQEGGIGQAIEEARDMLNDHAAEIANGACELEALL
ncbi:MAG: hypothetical protein JKX99_10055 [Robiginitomaculum sp.]|nr:hypothetical protein [Robiginitomaculum sp.]